MWITANPCRLTASFFFPEAEYVWWQQLHCFRLALRKLSRVMVKVKTRVLVPYNDLTMCRALNGDFCPKPVSLQFFQGGLWFSQSIHLIWEFLLLGECCSDSVPAPKVAQRGTFTSPAWNKPGLAWGAGSWFAKPGANQTQLKDLSLPFRQRQRLGPYGNGWQRFCWQSEATVLTQQHYNQPLIF